MIQMRIVALSSGTETIIIQWKTMQSYFTQETMSYKQFDKYMKVTFPKYYKYYEIAKEQQEEICNSADWFYNFGETMEMRRKGESYIFKATFYRRTT